MDYTKDHKNRVNSLLMEKWGYGKNKMEEGPEDEPFEGYDTPHVYDVVDAGGDYGDAYPGQSVARPESTPKLKAKAKKSISRSSNDNPHNRGDERDREGTNLYPEGQELEEMNGHPGKCCDMAHPDEEHDSYVDRISIRIAEELRTISITEELPAEEEPAAEPEAEFGKSKVGGGEFRKASIETGKEAGAGGFTSRERGVIGDLQKKMAIAAEAGDIVTGKALKLAKMLAAEMDAIASKK
jgi:hypothetical protein